MGQPQRNASRCTARTAVDNTKTQGETTLPNSAVPSRALVGGEDVSDGVNVAERRYIVRVCTQLCQARGAQHIQGAFLQLSSMPICSRSTGAEVA